MMQTSLRKALSTMNLGQIGFLCGNASAAKAKMVSLRYVLKLCVCIILHCMCHHVSTHLGDTFYIRAFCIQKNIRGFYNKKNIDILCLIIITI